MVGSDVLPQSTLKNYYSAIKCNLCLTEHLVEKLAHRAELSHCGTSASNKTVIHILTKEVYLANVHIDDFYGVEIAELAGAPFNRMTELIAELGLETSAPAEDY